MARKWHETNNQKQAHFSLTQQIPAHSKQKSKTSQSNKNPPQRGARIAKHTLA